VADRDPSVRS